MTNPNLCPHHEPQHECLQCVRGIKPSVIKGIRSGELVVVPREPTVEMVEAAYGKIYRGDAGPMFKDRLWDVLQGLHEAIKAAEQADG